MFFSDNPGHKLVDFLSNLISPVLTQLAFNKPGMSKEPFVTWNTRDVAAVCVERSGG